VAAPPTQFTQAVKVTNNIKHHNYVNYNATDVLGVSPDIYTFSVTQSTNYGFYKYSNGAATDLTSKISTFTNLHTGIHTRIDYEKVGTTGGKIHIVYQSNSANPAPIYYFVYDIDAQTWVKGLGTDSTGKIVGVTTSGLWCFQYRSTTNIAIGFNSIYNTQYRGNIAVFNGTVWNKPVSVDNSVGGNGYTKTPSGMYHVAGNYTAAYVYKEDGTKVGNDITIPGSTYLPTIAVTPQGVPWVMVRDNGSPNSKLYVFELTNNPTTGAWTQRGSPVSVDINQSNSSRIFATNDGNVFITRPRAVSSSLYEVDVLALTTTAGVTDWAVKSTFGNGAMQSSAHTMTLDAISGQALVGYLTSTYFIVDVGI
jgi:hypothetical protein